MPNLWHARAEVSYLQGAFNRHGYTVESSNRNFNFFSFSCLLFLVGRLLRFCRQILLLRAPCKEEHNISVMNMMLKIMSATQQLQYSLLGEEPRQ